MGLIDSIKGLFGGGDNTAPAQDLVETNNITAGTQVESDLPAGMVADVPTNPAQETTQGVGEAANTPAAGAMPTQADQSEQGMAYGDGTMAGDAAASIQDAIDGLKDNTPQQ